ncbi:hypothetical protein RJ639_002839, partial [Escallonia herrerae]
VIPEKFLIEMEFGDPYQQVANSKFECLLFDVDDTLYPLSSGLAGECTKNIKEYMIKKLRMEESGVPELCVQLYKDYGTTMAGLRAIGYEFDYDDYHSFVHGRLPYENLKPDHIFSNANKAHVAQVLSRLGLEDCFEKIICFETLNPTNESSTSNCGVGIQFKGSKSQSMDHSGEPNAVSVLPKSPVICKPFEEAFEQAFKIAEINPQKTLFFDDSIRNLQTAKCIGLQTVLVGSSHRAKRVDYALESIHNIREALPELWEALEKSVAVCYSGKTAIETPVRA